MMRGSSRKKIAHQLCRNAIWTRPIEVVFLGGLQDKPGCASEIDQCRSTVSGDLCCIPNFAPPDTSEYLWIPRGTKRINRIRLIRLLYDCCFGSQEVSGLGGYAWRPSLFFAFFRCSWVGRLRAGRLGIGGKTGSEKFHRVGRGEEVTLGIRPADLHRVMRLRYLPAQPLFRLSPLIGYSTRSNEVQSVGKSVECSFAVHFRARSQSCTKMPTCFKIPHSVKNYD